LLSGAIGWFYFRGGGVVNEHIIIFMLLSSRFVLIVCGVRDTKTADLLSTLFDIQFLFNIVLML